MSLSDALAYDAENVFCNAEEWAEACEFASPATAEPVRLLGTWGLVERDTERLGLMAHWRNVEVATASVAEFGELLQVRKGDRATLTKNPDDPLAAEAWTIASVSEADGMTRFECFLVARPTPRGGR